MSNPGFNAAAVYDPELYQRMLAIQRRQALAQSLLEQGGGNAGGAAYGGLKNAGNAILGAFLARGADKDMGALYAPQSGQPSQSQPMPQPRVFGAGDASSAAVPLAQQSVPEPQISNNPGSGPTLATIQPQPSTQALGKALQAGAAEPVQPPALPQSDPSPQALAQAIGGTAQQQSGNFQTQIPLGTPSGRPSDYGQLPPKLQQLYDSIPHLPALSARQTVMGFLGNQQAYMAEVFKQTELTPEQKNAGAAFGSGSPEYGNAMRGVVNKAGTTTITRGMGIRPDGSVIYAPPPAPAGYQYQTGPDGSIQLAPTNGGPQAVAGSAYAATGPKNLLTPNVKYDANGNPTFSNQADNSGNGPAVRGLLSGAGGPLAPQSAQPVPNIARNNPLNVSPGGNVTQYSTPTAGMGAAWDNLSSYARQGVNTIAGVMNRWAPYQDQTGKVINPDTPANIQRIAQQLRVDPNQPLNLGDPNLKGQLIDLMRPTETGNRYAPPPNPQAAPAGQFTPELPAGQAEFMKGGANTALKLRDGNINTAADVPTRLNVLSNIDQLVSAGAPVGSQEWMNATRNTRASLQQMFGGNVNVDDPAALMHEIQKYMGQYQLRMAQIQGGTGTDKQLEAVQEANPNEAMFPATVHRVVSWLRANEQGAAAKANANDLYLQRTGQTPANQLGFEKAWRDAYDPRAFQLQNMQPQEQAAFIKRLHPNEARALFQKRQALRALGAIQ